MHSWASSSTQCSATVGACRLRCRGESRRTPPAHRLWSRRPTACGVETPGEDVEAGQRPRSKAHRPRPGVEAHRHRLWSKSRPWSKRPAARLWKSRARRSRSRPCSRSRCRAGRRPGRVESKARPPVESKPRACGRSPPSPEPARGQGSPSPGCGRRPPAARGRSPTARGALEARPRPRSSKPARLWSKSRHRPRLKPRPPVAVESKSACSRGRRSPARLWLWSVAAGRLWSKAHRPAVESKSRPAVVVDAVEVPPTARLWSKSRPPGCGRGVPCLSMVDKAPRSSMVDEAPGEDVEA